MIRAPEEFTALREGANGMLHSETYERIYRTALSVSDSDVVEIGTAHGASAISAAWGLYDQDSRSRVYTLDRLEGGSRAAYGGRTTNEQIVAQNLQRFGVKDRVELLVGEAEDIRVFLPPNVVIGLVILDADGRIHRDIVNLWDHLTPNAFFVIDDYVPLCRLKPGGWRQAKVDAKMLLTYELANSLLAAGMLQRVAVLGRTLFARRGPSAIPDDFNKLVLEAYDKLVFMRAKKPGVRDQLSAWLRSSYPRSYRQMRAVFHGLRQST